MKVSKLIHDLHEKVEKLEEENVELKSNVSYSKDDLNRQITNLRIKQRELEKENVRLVAQLENDEHNVGHLDEKMKRLDYLEKVFASNRYVFSEIPNTPVSYTHLTLPTNREV